jgi:hypothetical protein
MEKLISEMCERTGISREQAEKVVSFMKENATRLPQMLQGGNGGGMASNIAGKVSGMMGRNK